MRGEHQSPFASAQGGSDRDAGLAGGVRILVDHHVDACARADRPS
jgi:hypothetical protein